MHVSFEEKTITPKKISQLEKILQSPKPSVVLHHSDSCGHCHVMRPEFNKFKQNTSHHVAEIEGSALSSLMSHQLISQRVRQSPMYFPMILVFIGVKKYVYTGDRTADGISSFIKAKAASAKPSKFAKLPATPSAIKAAKGTPVVTKKTKTKKPLNK